MMKRICTILIMVCASALWSGVAAYDGNFGNQGDRKLHIGLGLKQIDFSDGYTIDTYGGVIGWNGVILKSSVMELNVHTDLGFFVGSGENDEQKNVTVDDVNGAFGLSVGNVNSPVQVKIGAAVTFDYFTSTDNSINTLGSGGLKGFTEIFLNFPTGETNSFAGVKYEYNSMLSDKFDNTQTFMILLGTAF